MEKTLGMNEFILIVHIILITLACLYACKWGKAALITLISTCCILANLFVTKQITLMGHAATPSDALAIGAFMGTNLLQEYYGSAIAKESILISSAAGFFYTLMTIIHLGYTASAYDASSPHFYAILAPMPRLIIASFVSYFLVQLFSIRFAGLVKKIMPNTSFTTRNYLCLSMDQLLDTIIFSFLGLYGIVTSIGQVIVISYVLKMVGILITTATLYAANNLLKNSLAHESPI